jgi:flagellar biosynthesis/type III secretory pathway M-ring protein FliF/YscJ
MYVVSEYLAIAGVVIVFGAGVFAAVALVVLTRAAVRGLAQRARQAASQAAAAVAKLETNAVADSVRH